MPPPWRTSGRQSSASGAAVEGLPLLFPLFCMTMRILFVCSRNAGRSQMAEGIARALLPTTCQVFSAGERPSVLNGTAVRVMAERGVDISRQSSKGLSSLPFREYDVLVVLGEWEDPSRLPPSRRVIREILPDPAAFSRAEGDVLEGFRALRDCLWDRIFAWEREGQFRA